MRVRQENSVQFGKLLKSNARRCHPWQKAPQCVFEIGIGNEPKTPNFNQKRRMPDVSDLHKARMSTGRASTFGAPCTGCRSSKSGRSFSAPG